MPVISGGSALEPAMTAVASVLRGDATLTSLATGGVWNDIAQGTVMPYVRIGNPTEQPSDLMGRQGRELTIQTIVVSAYEGDLEAIRISSRIIELLNYTTLSLSGWTLTVSQYESLSTFDDEVEGKLIRHYPLIFRLLAHKDA